ncbi:bifunctional phosphoribosylaminoimidazolecarboxamide formyltransferase/IMP cyclohydrolase [Erysipelotrichaceae bacterium OttesenSCG-928-M19]|nr:bifunctional phosphoribosylaminoimidazolecarboxamide formyltransferase/IMP cyclohydrolase [Erysipelotrichaceae bacterium OttesenSCG-928-M19]
MLKKYALISLTDKSNLEYLVSNLIANDFSLIATTSTAQAIKDFGYECQLVEEITEFPEILNGRVKTLQPQIHGGILADLNNDHHLDDLKKHDINPISLVVCNLYPFEQVLVNEQKRHQAVVATNNTMEIMESQAMMDNNIIENIDIGGVTLIRAAAKNYKHVTLLCHPEDYQEYIKRLEAETTDSEYRKQLALKGFIHTANYDAIIANYFMMANQEDESAQLLISAPLKQKLRYGENPHQKAFYYENTMASSYSMNTSTIIQGKELSYNNLLDVDAGYNAIYEFDKPTAIALKHNTPCGIGFASNIYDAYLNCYNVDSTSIFGGIVIFNRTVDLKLAQKLNEIFLEIIIAPDFSKEALQEFTKKKNLRVIKGNYDKAKYNNVQLRSINGGYLMQEASQFELALEVVTTKDVVAEDKTALVNLYQSVKNVKSNAIIIGQGNEVLGISGGMVSRISACEFAIQKALEHPSYQKDKPLLLASDGFFPFNDIIDLALKYNIKYIIQPGGSINDEKLINACNENDMAMIFTKVRYFKH